MSKQFEEDRSVQSKNLPQYGKKGHKPRAKFDRQKVDLDSIHTNDIRYWNQTKGFENVTKFAWNNIIGRTYPYSELILPNGESAVTSSSYSAPAIMRIDFSYGPGYASDVNDGVNRSLAMVMAKIRASLSTSNIGFETADLGIFISATSSIALMIGTAKRVLEAKHIWKDKNYIYPRGLIQSMGFKWEDVAFKYNTYVAELNSLIDMYNGMKLLDVFMLYDRQYSMCHSIFADEDSEFGQLYYFMPAGYYTYEDTATPSRALWNKLPSFNTFQDFLDLIQTMLNSWYGSSDLYTINGCLHRALKDAPVQMMPHYEGETTEPVVDRAFLMQIMNMTICGGSTVNMDITQDPNTQNYVIWKPIVTYGTTSPSSQTEPGYRALCASSHILRLFENDVSADDNMELTRLMTFGTQKMSGQMMVADLVGCGSEIVTGIEVSKYVAATDSLVTTALSGNIIMIAKDDSFADRMKQLEAVSAFRYIPAFYVVSGDDRIVIQNVHGIYGDAYNWMLYSKEDFDKLQFQAYQSIWTPQNI